MKIKDIEKDSTFLNAIRVAFVLGALHACCAIIARLDYSFLCIVALILGIVIGFGACLFFFVFKCRCLDSEVPANQEAVGATHENAQS